MKRFNRFWKCRVSVLALCTGVSLAGQAPAEPGAHGPRINLNGPWQIQSSCKVAEKGDQISATSYEPKGWYPATVPGAVVANLVQDK